MGDRHRFGLAITLSAAIAVGAALSAVSTVAAASTTRVPVLMYHHIAQTPPPGSKYPGLYVTPAAFDAQLSALEAHGWHTITAAALGEAIRSRSSVPLRTFVITLDDGYADGYTTAWPIIKRHGFVATYFVVPGHIGRPGRLTWGMAAELARSGNEIANHTMDHVSLPSYHGVALAAQIDDAASAIESQLGLLGVSTTVRTFAYPYGHTSAEAMDLLASRRYTVAFTTDFGIASTLETEPLLSPRVRVSRGESASGLLATMGGGRLIVVRGPIDDGLVAPMPSVAAPAAAATAIAAPSTTTLAVALPAPSRTIQHDDRAAPAVPGRDPGGFAPSTAGEVVGIGGLGLLVATLLASAAMIRRKRR